MKEKINPEEARVELITAGLLVVVMALFLFGNVRDSLAMLAAGVVMLGSAVYQTQRGWHVGLLTWLLGVVFTLAGLGLRFYLVGVMRINFVALTLLGVGAYLFIRAFRR